MNGAADSEFYWTQTWFRSACKILPILKRSESRVREAAIAGRNNPCRPFPRFANKVESHPRRDRPLSAGNRTVDGRHEKSHLSEP
jgi:hypothetical protein